MAASEGLRGDGAKYLLGRPEDSARLDIGESSLYPAGPCGGTGDDYVAKQDYLDVRTGAHPFDRHERAERPDIFIITVDMVPRESYDPDSPWRQHLHTPNMDRLLGDGVYFRHAVSTSPLCGPSRAAYLTGRYPYLMANEERAHDGWEVALRPSDAIFPEYLAATGYATRHVGKCHVGAAKFVEAFGENDTPWNRWAPPLEDDDGYLQYLRELGCEPPVWHEPVQGLRPDRCTPGNTYGGWIRQASGAEFPPEATYSRYLAWLAEQTLESMLQRARLSKRRAPLYLQLDFFAPHQPFLVPEAYHERARELAAHISLPESYYQAMSGQAAAWPRVYEFYLRNWGLYDENEARRYMLMNLLQIEALDAAIGCFLAALDRWDLYEDALIVFAGDHGEMNCERGLIDKGVYGHPKVALVPLAVKLPGERAAGRQVDEIVSLLDLAPTLLETAGVEPADRLDGLSLLPLLRGESWQRPSPCLFECGWHVAPNPAVSLFADLGEGPLMYTYNLTSPRDELYALDDQTFADHAQDESWAATKQTMVRALGEVLEADARWTCYWHTFRLDKYEHLDLAGGDFQMFRPEER